MSHPYHRAGSGCSKCDAKRAAKRTRYARVNGARRKPLGQGWCPMCGKAFAKKREDHRFCSDVCRETYHDRRPKAGRTQYGPEHQSARREWAKLVKAAGGATCCLCGVWLDANEPWDLDHDPADPTRKTYRGVAHRRCNRADGARRGGRLLPNGKRVWRKRATPPTTPDDPPTPRGLVM